MERGDPWSIRRNEYAVEVKFGGYVRAVEKPNGTYRFVQEGYQSVIAVPYDYPVLGYNNNTVNTLRLWDAKPKNELDARTEGRQDQESKQKALNKGRQNLLREGGAMSRHQ